MEQRPTPSQSLGDSKRDLLEAREIAVRDEAERHTSPKKGGGEPKKPRLLPLLLVATLTFGVYTLVAKPAWLITPPPEPESPEIVEASLRVAMWQQALYVVRYQNQERQLPMDLVQAGAPHIDGVSYHQVGDTSYLITGNNGDVDLVLRSEESFDDFLGESLKIIATRGDS